MFKRKRIYEYLIFLFAFTLCGFYVLGGEFHNADTAAIAPYPKKKMIVGFNLGHLTNIEYADKALNRIKEDGFQYIRVNKIFTKRDEKTHKYIFEDLKKITDKGFDIILTFSSFPYKFVPSKKITSNARKRALETANFFPPEDVKAYGRYLRGFLEEMEAYFGRETLERWYFNIGNEPDGPKVFWGKPEEFEALFNESLAVIKEFNPKLKVGGSSFQLKFLINENRKPYLDFAHRIILDPAVDFFSFHIYNAGFPDRRPSYEILKTVTSHDKPKLVTEWNVSGRSDTDIENNVLDSRFLFNHLLDTLPVLYEAGIDYLMVFKLFDNPNPRAGKVYQLGLFKPNGKPKQGYKYILLLKEIVESGYKVYKRDKTVYVEGSDKLILASPSGNMAFDSTQYYPVETFFSTADTNDPVSFNWIILKQK